MSTIKPQTLKGFRDFLPDEKRRRDFIVQKIKEVFELFGFEPLETPTLEYADVLLGKYGEEADKLMYTFKDRGDRKLGLRYDQTVPTARVLTQYQNELPKYFRRYQIQNVFRADKPQQGRYREFTQCDIDIFGTISPISDAEIIATSYFVFKNVGYPQIKILVNDRQTLFKYLEEYANDKVNIFSIIQSVDKLEKIGQEKVVEELVKKGLGQKNASQAIVSIQSAKLTDNLKEIIEDACQLGVPENVIIFSPTLARGLDYYTGMIFEINLPGYEAGSCGGGGRYDKLIEQLGGAATPAVGIAFGFDRMVEAAKFFNIIPQDNLNSQVLVTVFDQDTVADALRLAQNLRDKKIKTEVYPNIDKLDKQLKYADKKGIPYVAIVGPEEVVKKIVKLKDMKTGTQQEITLQKLIEIVRN